jgi:hypothetical protein
MVIRIKEDKMMGHIASMEEINKAYKIVVRKPEGRRHL